MYLIPVVALFVWLWGQSTGCRGGHCLKQSSWLNGALDALNVLAWFTDHLATLKPDGVHWEAAQPQWQLGKADYGKGESAQWAEMKVIIFTLDNIPKGKACFYYLLGCCQGSSHLVYHLEDYRWW